MKILSPQVWGQGHSTEQKVGKLLEAPTYAKPH